MAKISLLEKEEREGEVSSLAYRLPVDVKEHCDFTVLADKVDYEDPALELALDLYISDDGKKWRHRAGMTCIGGKHDWTEPPSLSVPVKGIERKYTQVRMQLNKSVSIGLEMEDRDVEAIRSIG